VGWLWWLSPFGLAALARPFDTDRVLPLIVLAGCAAAVMAAARVAARRRDVRAGVLCAGGRRSWMVLLGSVPGFTVRSVLGPRAGWMLGVGAFYLLIGLISTSLIGFLGDNPQFAALARQAGFELDAVEGYVATLFALLAVPLAGFTTTRVAALAHADRPAGSICCSPHRSPAPTCSPLRRRRRPLLRC
jgi:polyether ionophore transport system permease protein